MKRFIKKYKSEIIIGGSALSAGILSFFLTLNLIPIFKGNNLKEQEMDVANLVSQNEISESQKAETLKVNVEKILEDAKKFENVSVVVEDIEQPSNTSVKEKLDIVENLSKEEEPKINNESPQQTDETLFKNAIVATSEKLEIKKELKFEMPTSGDIVLDYAKDKLVYSETLKEWITHDGVDIKAKEGTPVKAAEDGVITEIKMDPRYGNLIVIKHDDKYETVYSNLNMIDNIYTGKEIKKGEIIATVGEGFGFECKEGPHVHFEILENGECKKPY